MALAVMRPAAFYAATHALLAACICPWLAASRGIQTSVVPPAFIIGHLPRITPLLQAAQDLVRSQKAQRLRAAGRIYWSP